ncbi:MULTISPECIES: hypothetical protein [Nostocales]|nr:hypothetical protein [Tolypothrix bouteillei]
MRSLHQFGRGSYKGTMMEIEKPTNDGGSCDGTGTIVPHWDENNV